MSILGSRNVVGSASGALIGAFVGLLVGVMLDLLGSFLTIFEAFNGDGSGSWTFLVLPPVAVALAGADVGGFLGFAERGGIRFWRRPPARRGNAPTSSCSGVVVSLSRSCQLVAVSC